MRFDVHFKSLDYSQSLVDYIEEKFSKVSKYEIRPSLVHVTLTKNRHEYQVDVYIKGFQGVLRARAQGSNFWEAIDYSVDKIKRQMAKEKSRIKKHKWPEAA
jgi:putative sigma-54 modulation protein